MDQISIFFAFFAGVISFLSPCFFPVLPSFLGYIAGLSFSEKHLGIHKSEVRKKLILHTILFALGFAVVFLIIGAAIGFVGKFFALHRRLFQQIGGIFIILVGFYLLGAFNISFLQQARKLKLPKFLDHFIYLRSFLVGLFFAFGWAPCYGPIIGAIITLAAVKATLFAGIVLFISYILGFLVPLILMAFLFSEIKTLAKKIKRWYKYFSWISGVFVIVLGLLLLTDKFNIFAEILK